MTDNIIDVAAQRIAVLDYLRDGPFAKRDIIQKIGCSRSTVDRAIEELTTAGLVSSQTEGYETTLAGVMALDRRRTYEADATALRQAKTALAPLWKEAPIDMRLLREAEVTLLKESYTQTALSELRQSLQKATRIRTLLPALVTSQHLEIIHNRAIKHQCEVEVVCSNPLFDNLCMDHPEWLTAVVRDGTAALRTESLGQFGLFSVDMEVDESVWLVVFDQGQPHAVIHNNTKPAVNWANECFDTFWETATDRTGDIERETKQLMGERTVDTSPLGTSQSAKATTSVSDGWSTGDELIASGYSIDGNYLRTPGFGTENDCTVTLWFKTDGFTTDWETLVKWDYLTIGYRRQELFGHIFDPDQERIRARTDISSDRITSERWHHVAYTYDEETAQLYFDGTLADETEDTYPLEIRPLGACLGYIYRDRDTGVHTPDFHGQISDARFYATALSSERIQALSEATVPPDTTFSMSDLQ